MIRRSLLSLVLAAGLMPVSAHAAWQIEDLDGEKVALADYAGHWVVLNYWATWCKPCREEMPELDRLDRERDDLAVIGIAWEDTSREDLQAFLERTPVGYPILPVDPFEPPEKLAAPKVLPTTVIYAPGGEEADRIYGPVTRNAIENLISKRKSNGGD